VVVLVADTGWSNLRPTYRSSFGIVHRFIEGSVTAEDRFEIVI